MRTPTIPTVEAFVTIGEAYYIPGRKREQLRDDIQRFAEPVFDRLEENGAGSEDFDIYDQNVEAALDQIYEVQTTPLWQKKFLQLSELKQEQPQMIIEGALQQGTFFIGGKAEHGKTLIALAFAQAITLARPLFGIAKYAVKQPMNVVYLNAEMDAATFGARCRAFQLPDDNRFRVLTYESGSISLSDPMLLQMVSDLKPVLIFDTLSRFYETTNENDASQNRKLFDQVGALRRAGAPAVGFLHHCVADLKGPMTLKNMLRGTSDYGNMCDMAYGIRRDERLYNYGSGPLEIEMANLKNRNRLGEITRLHLAATRRNGSGVPISIIDQTGNFEVLDKKDRAKNIEETLNRLVTEDPSISSVDLAKETGLGERTVRRTLNKLGWFSKSGGEGGHAGWFRKSDPNSFCQELDK